MRRITTILLAALIVASALPAPAMAGHDDESETILNSVVTNDGGRLDAVTGMVAGYYQRAQAFFAARGDDETPAQHADNLQAAFNQNSGTIQSYVNKRANASTGANVLKLTFTENDEGSSTVYIVADVNGSDYENATAVDSTSRTVDEECTLEGAAARNADDELDRFVTEFAEPDKDTTARYKSELVTEYAGKISCSFL